MFEHYRPTANIEFEKSLDKHFFFFLSLCTFWLLLEFFMHLLCDPA
ncbi:rCG42659, partial [Rattus norvegicus]